MIEIFDNILPDSDASVLENFMVGDSFPWFFSQAGYYDTSTFVSEKNKWLVENDNNIKEFFVFSHMTYSYEEGVVSTFNDPCLKVLNSIIKTDYKLLRIKCNLSTRVESFKDTEYNIPHVDFEDMDSKTMLYYVNDSDGDTFFFDGEGKIIKRVSPKRGRAVLFNSNQLHAGSHPSKSSKRLTINFNFQNL